MVIFPNCKINIGLHVVRRREDGFHDLETIFFPVPLFDVLEIVQAENEDSFIQTGLQIEGPSSNNLCMKAVRLLRTKIPDFPFVKLHLHKAIPMGAGLGGGSSDGAYTLLLLNRKFNLGLTEQTLINLSLQLGSDCPFFILNKPCFAWGRGEMMKPIDLPMKGMQLVLINAGIHINTGWAFQQIIPKEPSFSLGNIDQLAMEDWKKYVNNDFEEAVTNAHPILLDIKNYCYSRGAAFAAMTGSGSTMFALYHANKDVPSFDPWPGIWHQKIKL